MSKGKRPMRASDTKREIADAICWALEQRVNNGTLRRKDVQHIYPKLAILLDCPDLMPRRPPKETHFKRYIQLLIDKPSLAELEEREEAISKWGNGLHELLMRLTHKP